MRRINWIAFWIALATGPLVVIVQQWLRPAVSPESVASWLLGPAPNLIVALCFPFIILVRPIFSPLEAARAFTLMTLATLAVLVVAEALGPIPGADTFDTLDLAASIAGLWLGVMLFRRLAPRLTYSAAPGPQPPPDVRA